MFGIRAFLRCFVMITSLTATASPAIPLTMVCVAKHPSSEKLFTGEGLGWIGARQAIALCKQFAIQTGLDGSACKIDSCEPADLTDFAN